MPNQPSPKSKPERFDSDDECGRLRARLMHHYVLDRRFLANLRQLARQESDIADVYSAVGQFCMRWGLTFNGDQAERAIFDWCEDHRADPTLHPCGVIAYFSWGGFSPRNASAIRLHWDPREESRRDAEKRLRGNLQRQLKAFLDTVETNYGRYDAPSRKGRHMLETHMGWLFQRQCHGLSYKEIAKRHPKVVESEAVRMACSRLAVPMKLELRRTGFGS